ncbi:hypothetical protein AALP_AAs63547U000200 [Arabis alpina]|uniref:ADP-ribosyl cyclase/cyclic ADP-ribose hydrolase n=1 Tax=Arabis alpina TaxID=50452 RepID=A0A087G342_ARAAL|nr:hypothetical protein AALP_AAs63547U000200 [Arabis alpina]
MEFQRKGITLFNDNEITRGESIGPELFRAIEGSKVVIVLLSKNYASSKWCLGELVEIMKCREELGQTVMVIFYKVDPSDVKNLTGDFGEVFRKTCAGKTKKAIGRWRQTLAKVGTIAGYHSSNWDNEAAMIKEIATDISNKLNYSTALSDFDGYIGMRSHLEKMEPLLCLNSDEVRMIGIWGPPGIGKTTIARAAYHQLSNSFQLSVFMDDIKANFTRPCSDDYKTKLQLQQQFMSQITNHEDMKITHLGVVQDRLKDKRVLVVLDGVDKSVQLDAMAKETWWFGPGSRIIITTQDQKLFRAHGINHIYKVEFPPTGEALQIFCMYAFGQNYAKDCFEELAWEVTSLAGKLPLGLRVMGSYFRGLSKQEWTKSLPRLRTSLNADIHSILKLSYDALDDEDKDLFLHIACFFKRVEIKRVEEYLAKTFMEVRQRLNVLAEKALISINSGCIGMHSLLEKLGREIVRKQSIHEPSQRSFLVDTEEILEVLTGDPARGGSVIGIDFNYCGIREELNISERTLEGMSNLQFLKIYGDFNMLYLPRGLNYLSPKLRLLYWHDFPMTCLPATVNFKFLIELTMHNSKLEKLWEGIKPLRNLKWMALRYSVNLKELPNLSTATNLQKLDLRGCSSLIKLPSSIGNCTKLKKLYLGGCSNLVEFPSIGNAIDLQSLDLRSFSNLVKLPSSIGNATNLENLDLGDCSNLVELPLSIENLQKLRILRLEGCTKLEVLPTNVNLESLDILDLTDCSMLKSYPKISTNVKFLMLGGTAIEEVPPSIRPWSRVDAEIQEVFPRILKRSSLLKLVKRCRKLLSLPKDIILNFAKCVKLNQEARDLIIQTTKNAVLPGREVPMYFTHRATSGDPLTIKLNERPLSTSMSEHSLDPALTEHLYTFQVEADVTSSELVFEFKLNRNDSWMIQECGIVQLMDSP